MRLMSKWLFRLRAAVLPSRMEEAMKEEMDFHIEMEARKLMASGMAPREAMRKARIDFGEPEYHKEKARETWGISMIQNFRIDARHSLRGLRRNPLFALVAILTLGMGIGASTSIFSVVNGILFRDLPFPDPDRLTFLCEARPEEAGGCYTASTPNVSDWAAESRSFEDIGVFRWWGHILELPDGSLGVSSLIATPDFFRVMGYQPAVGRVFQAEDQLDGNRNRVVLDHDFWVTQFGSDEGVVGSTILLGGEAFQVIGVLRAGQKPPALESQGADVWLPLHFDPRANDRRDWRGFYAVGRLSEDGNIELARQEIEAVHRSLLEEYPEANRGWGVQLVSLHERVVGNVKNTLLVFLGAVGLLLLITCVNIANLILARLSARETEMGIRAALGAGKPRLTGQLLTEGLVLAVLGSSLGLLIAWGATPLFLTLAPSGIPRLESVRMDGQVLAFTVALAGLATVFFGTAPLVRAARVGPMEALKSGRQGKGSGAAGGLNGILVISEVALALALLVGAGLLVRSFSAFNRWNPGIDRDQLAVFSASVSTGGYQGVDAVMDVYRTLDRQLLALPGVESVARGSAGPLFGGYEPDQVLPAEAQDSEGSGIQARWYDVSPSYFETLGIGILRGRSLTSGDDRESTPVCVINQTLAQRLWPDQDPVGRQLWMKGMDMTRQVVGVVEDVPPLDPDAPVDAEMFFPQAQYTRAFSYFIVRTEGDPASVMPLLADRVHAVDKEIQVGAPRDYPSLMRGRLVQPRFNMLLVTVFSVVALLLAAVGIYGVVSRAVAARTREIGIRLALGAQQTRVVREVVGRSAILAAAGVACGLILASFLSRFIQSLLHGVAHTDPATYLAVAMLILTVALLASLVPALRASRVDPMHSLREE